MPEQAENLTITDPAVLRVVADPVRLRLLQEFAEPRTIGEAAKRIGVTGKGIYRQVDMLLGAGLVRVVSTKQKRGTVERTLQMAAKNIVAVIAGHRGFESRADSAAQMVSVRMERADIPDFEAAVVDLVREYASEDGDPVSVSLVAKKG